MPSSKYWYHFVLFLQTLIVFFRKLTDNISFLCSETVQDYLKFITQKNLEISSRRFREFHGQRAESLDQKCILHRPPVDCKWKNLDFRSSSFSHFQAVVTLSNRFCIMFMTEENPCRKIMKIKHTLPTQRWLWLARCSLADHILVDLESECRGHGYWFHFRISKQ